MTRTVRETVPRLDRLGAGSPQAHTVDGDRHRLPARGGRRVPAAAAGLGRTAGRWSTGKTSLMVLSDQLDLLGRTLDKISTPCPARTPTPWWRTARSWPRSSAARRPCALDLGAIGRPRRPGRPQPMDGCSRRRARHEHAGDDRDPVGRAGRARGGRRPRRAGRRRRPATRAPRWPPPSPSRSAGRGRLAGSGAGRSAGRHVQRGVLRRGVPRAALAGGAHRPARPGSSPHGRRTPTPYAAALAEVASAACDLGPASSTSSRRDRQRGRRRSGRPARRRPPHRAARRLPPCLAPVPRPTSGRRHRPPRPAAPAAGASRSAPGRAARRRAQRRSRPRPSRSCSPSWTRSSACPASSARSTGRPQLLRVEKLRDRGTGLTSADDHPAPGVPRQPRAPARRRSPAWSPASTGARAAQQGAPGRGRPVRAGRRATSGRRP